MKKLLYTFVAVATALAAAGCARELAAPQSGSDAVEVTFTVTAPGIATKAISDGTGATDFTFAVYDQDGHYLQALSEAAEKTGSNPQWKVTVPVVKDLTYQFAFIAKAATSPYAVDLANKTVTATYGNANDDAADFFYATLTETIGNDLAKSVDLVRPLAQVNVGAADLVAAGYSLDVANMKTGIQLTGINNELNILDGTVSGAADITLAEAARVDEGETEFVEGYKRIAMGYVLVGDKQTSDATINITAQGKVDGVDHAITREVANIPLQANYRTNILGNIFTGNMTFTVNVVPGFVDVDGNPTEDYNVVPEVVSGIAALNAQLVTDKEESTDLNYEVTEVDDNTITIPAGTSASSLTFNLGTFDTGVTTLTVTDEDTGNGYAHDIIIEVPEGVNLSTLTINTPSAHVVLKQGTYTQVIASTSGTTFVVDEGTSITTLTVNQGSVEIYGTVETITNNTGATLFVKGSADYTPAAEDNIIYCKEATTGNVVLNNTYSVYPELINNALAVGLYAMNLDEVTVKLAAGTYDCDLVFSGNSSPWHGKHANRTVNVVGATGNASDVILKGQVFSTTTTVILKDLTLTNVGCHGLAYYKTQYGSNGEGFQSQNCNIMLWTTGAVDLDNVTLINGVTNATTIYTYWGTGTMNVRVNNCRFQATEGIPYQRHFQIYGKTDMTVENSSFSGIYRYVACVHGGYNTIVWRNNTVTGLNPDNTCYGIEYGTSTSGYWDGADATPDNITVSGGTYPYGATFIPYYKVANGYRNEPVLSGTMPNGSAAEWGMVNMPEGLSIESDGSLGVTAAAGLEYLSENFKEYRTDLEVDGTTVGNCLVFNITEDIDMSGIDFDSFSANGYTAAEKTINSLIINGNNHTITNLNKPLVKSSWAGKSRVTINDLTIKDADIDDSANSISTGIGAFIGWPQASEKIIINNCHVINSTIKGAAGWTGGIIGYANGYSGPDGPVFEEVEITNCSVEGCTITGKGGSVGAIMGHATGDAWTKVTAKNVTVKDNTISTTKASKAGSLFGTIGVAGTEKTVNEISHTCGTYVVSSTWSNNTVTDSNGAVTRTFGRVASTGGKYYIDGDLVAHNDGNGDVVDKVVE
mgnify:CR=1 FL=1